MLKSKVLDTGYTVREIKVRDMLTIMPRFQGTTAEQQAAQVEMMMTCVEVDGKPIGESVMDLGISAYLTLADEVMAINGMGKNAGNA